MDMLEIGTNTMTELEEQTHMSFWSALKSPLIIGCDLTNISKSSLDILKNKNMLEINQDNLGKAVTYIESLSTEKRLQVWGGPLSSHGNKYVLLVLNESPDRINVTSIPLSNLPGLDARNAKGLSGYDVWADKKIGRDLTTVSLGTIESHQTRVILLS